MIDYNFLNPGICLIISSVLLNFIPKKLYRYAIFILLLLSYSVLCINGYEQLLFEDVRLIFILASIFFIVLFASLLIATEKAALSFLYVGATISILFTKNLLYIFLFLEIMMMASSLIILRASGTEGMKYFKFHMLGGTILLIGIMSYYFQYNSFELGLFHSNLFILLGLLVNLAIPPFSSWLLGGYMVVPQHVGLILSICTTKISALLVMKLFAGLHCLIFIGLFTTCYSLLYAIFERNIKRTVLYLILAEIGMILIFIGTGENIINTSLLFIINDMLCVPTILYSANLIASGRANTKTSFLALLSIASFPFTLGYISKRYLYGTEYLAMSPWMPTTLTIISSLIIYTICRKFAVFSASYKANPTQNYALPMLFLALLAITSYFLAIFGTDILTIDKFFIKQALLPLIVGLLAFLSKNYVTYSRDMYELDPNALYPKPIYRLSALFIAKVQYFHQKLTPIVGLQGLRKCFEANLVNFNRNGIGMSLVLSIALLLIFLLCIK